MKPCYESLKEIGVDVDEIWKENVRFEGKYRIVTPSFDHLCKMKLCYECLKEIGVDVDKIWSENVRSWG